jgi:molecular chaperone GrpE
MTTSGAKDGWFDDGPDADAERTEVERNEAEDDAAGDDPAAAGDASDGPGSDDASDEQFLEEGLLFGEADTSAFDADSLLASTGASDAAAERDEYRDALLRVKADFDNYKKRVAKDHAATVERAAEKLVAELLPVLDACEAALSHGLTDVEPIYKSLLDTLEKGGLLRVDPVGEPFDPNLHEAVMHEPGDDDEHVVIECLRTGYAWNGRVLRPAMVKVRG